MSISYVKEICFKNLCNYCLVVPSIKVGVGYRSEPRAPDGWLHTPNVSHPVVHGPGSQRSAMNLLSYICDVHIVCEITLLCK